MVGEGDVTLGSGGFELGDEIGLIEVRCEREELARDAAPADVGGGEGTPGGFLVSLAHAGEAGGEDDAIWLRAVVVFASGDIAARAVEVDVQSHVPRPGRE